MTEKEKEVHFVGLEDGTMEDVTREELETVSDWLDAVVEEAKARPRCPTATALE